MCFDLLISDCHAGFVLRLAVCPGKPGRPTIVISKSFNIYLGNTGDEEMLVKEGELFGFGTGSFEVKLIQGSLKYCMIVKSSAARCC